MGTEVLLDVGAGGATVAPPSGTLGGTARRGTAETPRVRDPETAALPARQSQPLNVAGRLLLGLPIVIWAALDTTIVAVAILTGYAWFGSEAIADHVAAWHAIGVLAGSIVVCSLIFGLHERKALLSGWHIVTRMFLTTAASAVLTYSIIYVVMYTRFSRRVAALAVISYLVIGLAIRLFACFAVRKIKRRILIVGPARACDTFVDRMDTNIRAAHKIVGFAGNAQQDRRRSSHGLKELGTTADIVRTCTEMGITDIVVCNGIARNPALMDWMLPCLRMGCRITNEATFYEKSAGQILVDEVTPEWFLFSDLKTHCDEYASIKRAFDVVTSLIGLALTLPFYPLLALAIKLGDGGPVLYWQDRVGKNGSIFRLYKFRTMRIDAENGKSVWATKNDPRATRVGRILRKTRLDEVPQFFNILSGQMSLIGPRPERPVLSVELRRRIPFWAERTLVKPGLTGWAQISYHYGNTVADAKRKLQFDLYYIKHMGLELDVIILFRTIGTFLRGAC